MIMGCLLSNNAGRNAGYTYDYYRQRGKRKREQNLKYIKLKKKTDKLAKKNKYIKPRK